MGRSVETIGKNVIYFDARCDEGDYEYWQDLIENLQGGLAAKYKSLGPVDKCMLYGYRENRIILENSLVQIGISEYCGCGAISIFADCSEYPELAEHWLEQNIAGIKGCIKIFVTTLRRLGTFSNGCGVFEKE